MIRQHIYGGTFVLPGTSSENAYLIISDRDNPVERMRDELNAHTESEWEILPTYAGMLDKKNAKQLTFVQKLQAIIELKNSIPEDEFEFIRVE